jgi:hypothetical protein
MITLRLQQIRVPPGQRILLEAISWHEFEAMSRVGRTSGTRIAYNKGILEIVTAARTCKAKVVRRSLGSSWTN